MRTPSRAFCFDSLALSIQPSLPLDRSIADRLLDVLDGTRAHTFHLA